MNYQIFRLVLIDYEIDRLNSKKKHIDYRLDELYREREDTFVDLMYQESRNDDKN